ncbi:MAG: hypothetical protein FD143_1985 [Ignavibacteria bacterium]|nr:MAG: hypothetical protein FD143_1985 [Ignavibacteria bacterium]KAF0159306.1 MAG: hypothetical protein FD188_2253 [Ignavibacteria bacterium]
MIIKNLRSILFLILLVCSFTKSYSQEVDITASLKSIEAGKISEAETIFQRLQNVNAAHPDVIFLSALLTKSGEESVKKYSLVFENHPKSKYADVSLFRVFSYYYSLGLYKRAESYFKRLKIDYPASPYIAAADRRIPDIDESVNEKVIAPMDSSQKIQSGEPANAKFTIQAGAFLSVENATRLKDQLIADGFESEIINRVVGGSLLKIVTAGKFAKEEEAKSALIQIESKHRLKGRVIPFKP